MTPLVPPKDEPAELHRLANLVGDGRQIALSKLLQLPFGREIRSSGHLSLPID
jgi:hypothetical protein